MDGRRPRRWRRRLAIALAGLVLVAVAAVFAFPWFLGTPLARRWLLAQADHTLAPAKLEIGTFRFSWFGPMEMTSFVIRDHQGDRVVDAPRANWDRDLGHILFDRPRYGTLTLDGAKLDVERLPDGTVDLYEALKPILGPKPNDDLTIRIRNGTVRVRSAGLAEPLLAKLPDLLIRRPPRPRPLTWSLDLAQDGGRDSATLTISGSLDRWKSDPPELIVSFHGQRWPLALDLGGTVAHTLYDGESTLQRATGLWATTGKVTLSGLDASGTRLRGDHLQLDRVVAAWDVAETKDGWDFRRFDVDSPPVGSLRATGPVPAPEGRSTRIEGRVDLAALARALPNTLHIREGLSLERGTASMEVQAGLRAGRRLWQVEGGLSDLIARDRDRTFTLKEPASISARLLGGPNDLELERLAVKTPFLDASGHGDVDRGIEINATVDLGGFQRQARDLIDFGSLELAGNGRLSAEYRRQGQSYKGRLKADLNGLHLAGAGPVSIDRDALQLETTLQGASTVSGLPRDWDSLAVALKSGDLAADLVARSEGAGVNVDANLSTALSKGEKPGIGKALLAGRWTSEAFEIAEARLEVTPGDPALAADGTLAIASRGRFDRASGALTLDAMPAAGTQAIRLSADGIRVAGLTGPGFRAEVGLTGDVAAVSRVVAAWTDTPPWKVSGSWASRLSLQKRDGLQFGSRLVVRDLVLGGDEGRRVDGPVALTLRGAYREDSDQIDLAELSLSTSYATIDGSGRLLEPMGRRVLDLKGNTSLDQDRINGLIRANVEPNATVALAPRRFFVKGPLSGADGQKIEAEGGINLTEADVYGMKVGAVPIAVAYQDGKVAIEPIRTTLNGGRLVLDPELHRDGGGNLALRLAPGSEIENALVNDEVSHRFLAFVAPVLDNATKVHGRVSAKIDRAEFPLVADAGRKAVVEGRVLFQDVEFAPGPLSQELLDLIGRRDAVLRLDEPVAMAIADGKVYQRGFALPIGRLTRIELEGAVGFDRTLDLRASLPLTPAMVANNNLLGAIVDGARITVPIRGTLAKPAVDRQAFNLAMKDLGKGLLQRGAAVGGAELLMRLLRPREPDPNAPPPLPPPTPEERRARREAKKMERLEKKAQKRRGAPF